MRRILLLPFILFFPESRSLKGSEQQAGQLVTLERSYGKVMKTEELIELID